jgi:excisionase family DNA binding protein
MRKLLKVKEIQEILNISRSHAYKLIETGILPSVRLGNKRAVRVFEDDLMKFITERRKRRANVR